MADLSDVTAFLAQAVLAAVYPAGTASPSVTGADVYVSEGFPLEGQIDPTIKAGGSEVTIYAAVGGPQNVDQYLRHQELISPPVLGLNIAVDDDALTLTSSPTRGEFITVLLNGSVTLSSAKPATVEILADLALQAATAFPSVSVTSGTITFPGAYSLVARSGATGLVGEILHRQKSVVTITVWAPTPAARSTIASAVDMAIKRMWRMTLPDSSQAFVRYNTTRNSDERQNVSIYRRDLVYEVEYSTMDIYEGVAITGVQTTVDDAPNSFGSTS